MLGTEFKHNKHYFLVEIGDHSGDGHMQIDKYLICSDICKDKFELWFSEIEIRSFDEYQDNKLNDRDIEYLKSLGLSPENYCEFYYDEYSCCKEEYVKMVLDIMMKKFGCEFNIVDIECVELGGYGLFQ